MGSIVKLCRGLIDTIRWLQSVLLRLECSDVGLQLVNLMLILGLTVSLHLLDSGSELDGVFSLELAPQLGGLSLMLFESHLLLAG